MKFTTRRRKVIFSIKRYSRPKYDPTLQPVTVKSTMADDSESSVEELDSSTEIRGPLFRPAVPRLFASSAPLRDDLTTSTSEQQDQTVQECLPYLQGIADPSKTAFDFSSNGVARLEREEHIDFLTDALEHARFMAYDPSRPWVVYWTLTGLSLLGQDVSIYRSRVIQTFRPAQNVTGGFGGGHGQISHCAPSYAVVLSLAMVGGQEALDLVERNALWHWLGQIKHSDGGFSMCVGGEKDVRGAYCAMTMISLLSLPLELPPEAPARQSGLKAFTDKLPEYLSRCQAFEGGISASPQTEGHGAFAFCALACLCILGPPNVMITKYLNLPLLMSWLSARQYAPEGGFSGRTNKLVDGCYSHWVGGCWPLIEAALGRTSQKGDLSDPEPLYSQEGLIRYILSCCQAEGGGLRDKPSAPADAYHSCYSLAGLSSAQHGSSYQEESESTSVGRLSFAMRWSSRLIHRSQQTEDVSDPDDLLLPLHPIYVIPWSAAEEAYHHYSNKVDL